jgi:hypothetical protein
MEEIIPKPMQLRDRKIRLRKLGCYFSLIFGLIASYSTVRIIMLGEPSKLQKRQLVIGWLSLPLTDVLLAACFLIVAVLAIYEDRRLWKPWLVLFGSPGIVILANLFPALAWRSQVFIRFLSICLATYSFVAFLKSLKKINK